MMKKYTIFILLFSLLFGACREADDVNPSGLERDWMVVTDNPNDSIDHKIYEIFKSTGIPIFYNDTIGSMLRETTTGYEYMYHEILKVFYDPGAPKPVLGRYTLVKDHQVLMPLLDLLETEILPTLPESMVVTSIFLVDTLESPLGETTYVGFNTVAIGKTMEFLEMDDAEKKLYKGTVLQSLVSGRIVEKETKWLEEEFYALTYASAALPTSVQWMYSTDKRTNLLSYATIGFAAAGRKVSMDAIGFIKTKGGGKIDPEADPLKVEVPQKFEDVDHYCEAIFAYTEAEFKAIHGKATVVMSKYYAMREKLKEYGFAIE